MEIRDDITVRVGEAPVPLLALDKDLVGVGRRRRHVEIALEAEEEDHPTEDNRNPRPRQLKGQVVAWRRLRALPFATPVSLGPRILRGETAAIAAMALWMGIAGDWR